VARPIVDIATGEVSRDAVGDDGKNPAMVPLDGLDSQEDRRAWTKKLSTKRREEIARKAAVKGWRAKE
jgi:hypothetical protein